MTSFCSGDSCAWMMAERTLSSYYEPALAEILSVLKIIDESKKSMREKEREKYVLKNNRIGNIEWLAELQEACPSAVRGCGDLKKKLQEFRNKVDSLSKDIQRIADEIKEMEEFLEVLEDLDKEGRFQNPEKVIKFVRNSHFKRSCYIELPEPKLKTFKEWQQTTVIYKAYLCALDEGRLVCMFSAEPVVEFQKDEEWIEYLKGARPDFFKRLRELW